MTIPPDMIEIIELPMIYTILDSRGFPIRTTRIVKFQALREDEPYPKVIRVDFVNKCRIDPIALKHKDVADIIRKRNEE